MKIIEYFKSQFMESKIQYNKAQDLDNDLEDKI